MRISDWSSDVCSSDLLTRLVSNGASRVPTPKAQSATTGRLMKKIHGQLQLSLMTPPRIGPRIGAVVVVIAQMARPIPAFSLGKMRSSRIRSEEHTSELQSLMRISYAVFCLNKKKHKKQQHKNT